jgi:hypothetical protein
VLWCEVYPSALPRLAELDVDLDWEGLGGRNDVTSNSCCIKDYAPAYQHIYIYIYIYIYIGRAWKRERGEGKEGGREKRKRKVGGKKSETKSMQQFAATTIVHVDTQSRAEANLIARLSL